MAAIVKRSVPQLRDHHEVEEACLDTLLICLEKPSEYDPTKSTLLTYLTMGRDGAR
jgi:hypothetical protein